MISLTRIKVVIILWNESIEKFPYQQMQYAINKWFPRKCDDICSIILSRTHIMEKVFLIFLFLRSISNQCRNMCSSMWKIRWKMPFFLHCSTLCRLMRQPLSLSKHSTAEGTSLPSSPWLITSWVLLCKRMHIIIECTYNTF